VYPQVSRRAFQSSRKLKFARDFPNRKSRRRLEDEKQRIAHIDPNLKRNTKIKLKKSAHNDNE